MADIFVWIKRMIYLAIFLTLLLQILPNGTYRKYVKFFAGLVFVITIFNPLMQLFHQDGWEDKILSELVQAEGKREAELDFSYMEEKQKEYYTKNMSDAVEELVLEKAQNLGVEVGEIEVKSGSKDGSIRHILIRAKSLEASESRELKSEIAKLFSLDDSQVEVQED